MKGRLIPRRYNHGYQAAFRQYMCGMLVGVSMEATAAKPAKPHEILV